jgi:hypothetical protein
MSLDDDFARGARAFPLSVFGLDFAAAFAMVMEFRVVTQRKLRATQRSGKDNCDKFGEYDGRMPENACGSTVERYLRG